MTTTTPKHRVHEGRNVKRFREMLGIKKDALAADLGHDWNQQRVSLLEQRETIELDVLQQVATVLHLPRAYCHHCGSWEAHWQPVSGHGRVDDAEGNAGP